MKEKTEHVRGVSVRIPRDLWRELKVYAAQHEEKLGDVIRQRLEVAFSKEKVKDRVAA